MRIEPCGIKDSNRKRILAFLAWIALFASMASAHSNRQPAIFRRPSVNEYRVADLFLLTLVLLLRWVRNESRGGHAGEDYAQKVPSISLECHGSTKSAV